MGQKISELQLRIGLYVKQLGINSACHLGALAARAVSYAGLYAA